jgi:hypothetical protein
MLPRYSFFPYVYLIWIRSYNQEHGLLYVLWGAVRQELEVLATCTADRASCQSVFHDTTRQEMVRCSTCHEEWSKWPKSSSRLICNHTARNVSVIQWLMRRCQPCQGITIIYMYLYSSYYIQYCGRTERPISLIARYTGCIPLMDSHPRTPHHRQANEHCPVIKSPLPFFSPA